MDIQGQNSDEIADWRDKFLSKVDELEHAEGEAKKLQDILKSGLIRLSLAADGLDIELDKELDELRHLLKNNSAAFRLQQHLEKIKETILGLDQKKQRRVQQCITAMQSLSSELQVICIDKSQTKDLELFVKQLKYRTQDEMHYSQLISELAILQQQVLSKINTSDDKNDSLKSTVLSENITSKPKKLFQSLFHSKTPVEIAEDLNTHNDSSLEEKSVPSDALNSNSSSNHNKAEGHDNFDLDGLMEEVFDGDKLQQQKLDQQSQNPQPSPLGKPKSFNDSAIRFQRQKYQQGENVDFDTIAEHISDILSDLYDQLDAEGQALDYIHAAEAQLDKGLNCIRLIPTLEDTSHAIISLQGQNQQDFSNYLATLNISLEHIHKSLSIASENHTQSTRDLDSTLTQEIMTLQEDVKAADDLQSLKVSVQERAERLFEGIETFKKKSVNSEHSLASQLFEMQHRIQHMEKEAEETQNQLQEQRQQALTDTLTQLPNRAAFNERLEVELNRWQRYQHPLCVLLIDIDLFKQVNDNWGHQAGDKVLQIIAKQMKSRLRDTDFIARFGGEEFIILLTDCDIKKGMIIAENLRETVENCPFHFHDSKVKITISSGLAAFNEKDDFNDVFERADQAMYMAKHAGRNAVYSELNLH